MSEPKFEKRIDHQAIQEIFGISLDQETRQHIDELDLLYREASSSERDAHILRYLRFLSEEIEPAGPNRRPAWEAGWQQNLDEFKSSNLDIRCLTPYYYRRDRAVMRLNGNFIVPKDANFELTFLSIVHKILSKTLLDRFKVICELGAGPVHNVVGFAKELRGKKFIASDWVSQSSEIIEIISENKLTIGFETHEFSGAVFDFNDPRGLNLPPESLVLTFGSMEQLGKNFDKLLAYFLKQPVREFLHIEPIIELYDRTKLFDELAYQYSIKRNYLNGYYTTLQALNSSGKIKILKVQKLLGSGFHDGWTLIHWRKE